LHIRGRVDKLCGLVDISTRFSRKHGYPQNNLRLIQSDPAVLLAPTLALRVLSSIVKESVSMINEEVHSAAAAG
jgi:hypothetical protein